MNVRLCHWFSHIENWIYCNLNSWRSEKHTSGYNNISNKSHITRQCHWTVGLVACRQRNLSCSFWLVCNLRDPLIRGSRWHQGYVSGPSFLHRGDLERSNRDFPVSACGIRARNIQRSWRLQVWTPWSPTFLKARSSASLSTRRPGGIWALGAALLTSSLWLLSEACFSSVSLEI